MIEPRRVFLPVFFLLLGVIFCMPGGWAEEGFLQASDGFKIFYEYETVPEEEGCVLLVHGWGMNSGEWSSFKGDLLNDGWSVLAIDLRGHGSSIDHDGEQFLYEELKPNQFTRLEKDVQAALDFASARHGKVWLMGSSIGANLALRVAAGNAGVKGLVLFSPAYAYGNLTTRNAIRKYGDRPVMIIASEEDPPSGIDAPNLHAKATGRKKLVLSRRKEHGTGLFKAEPGLRDTILDWMLE